MGPIGPMKKTKEGVRMSRIYIVRHGETEANKEELFRGRKDIPLNDTGMAQAEKTGRCFADKRIGRVVSSPLLRARQTSEPIGKWVKVAVEEAEEFTDMDFGIWEGLPLRDVKRLYPEDFALWAGSPQRLSLKDAESLVSVRRRLKKGLSRVLAEANENIVIVTHRVICKVMVLHFLNISSSHFWDIKFDEGSVTIIENDGRRSWLCVLNDTCHLNHPHVASQA
jgi:phosphoserine phosphatase